jgi:hypothetical protein
MITGFRELKPEPSWIPPTEDTTGGWEPQSQFIVCEECGAVVENDHLAIDTHADFHGRFEAVTAAARSAHLATRGIN